MGFDIYKNDSKGYYSLYIAGVFYGNYDTYMEAVHAAMEAMNS